MAYNRYAAEYARERKLLLQQVRRMKKRGYVFPDMDIPNKPKRIRAASVRKLKNIRENIYKKAALPDVTTGEIKKVGSRKQGLKQEKTINKLYAEKARSDQETAKWLEAVETYESSPEESEYTLIPEKRSDQWSRSDWENERAGRGGENLPEFADMIINNFKQSISEYNAPFVGYINNWIDNLVNNPDIGKEAVANMLQEGAERGLMINYKVAYDRQLRESYISDMMSILQENTDVGQFTIDELWEQMDESEGMFYEGMTAAEAAGL